MSVVNQVKAEHSSPFQALSSVADIDGERMIKRLCKHFSHKVNAGWNEGLGYIEFAMGFCDMNADKSQLSLRCGANSIEELTEITDCIDSHFVRFAKQRECSLKWRIINS